MSNAKQNKLHRFKIPKSNMKILLKKLSQKIVFDFFHQIPSLWDHSKSTFARNFQFLTPPLLLFFSSRFTCTPPHPTPPHHRPSSSNLTFALVSYPFPSEKKFLDAYDAYFEK